ncbi:copper homeostasis protein CutC [Virgibacillus necropolis]|uniref:PF03932 family protein CutC n=1 Tax=Virgibacillus necropolis TaxID=163877 RepID=A0A221M973_9BACI|nr:copper homeostasis protein CutC [Virgibacillus necropolis]ASN04175.1 copper homeostasis protein [Virgibacillus necropolis]
MNFEVIATSVYDAQVAAENGANRIELVKDIDEGGLTPCYALIKEVVQAVNIPVNVMIRPHSYTFCYSERDLLIMTDNIRIVRELGATGIVLGTLNHNHTIDETALQNLLAAAGKLDVTFHRAFDEVIDQEAALTTLFEFPQVNRVLTSGGKKSVIQATNQIKKLRRLTDNNPCNIIAGSGLSIDNVKEFIEETGIKEIHFGSGVRIGGNALKPIDPEKVRAIVKVIEALET